MNLKESLFVSAFDLFLKYGIKSVSMDDICKKIGISKKTCYNVISTKEELVHNVLEKHLLRDEEEITRLLEQAPDAVEGMINISRHVLQFLDKMTPSLIHDLKKYHPQAWKLIETRHLPFIQKSIYHNLKRGQKEGLYQKDFNPDIISRLYVLLSLSVSDQDHFKPDDYSKVKLFKEIIKYHLNGILSEEGKQLINQKHKNFFAI